jgi:hypothetical protein
MVTAAVAGGNGTPTGSVTLSSGSFTSAAVALNTGSATFYVQPDSLAQGADPLTVTYTPDSSSSSTYATSTDTASITIRCLTTDGSCHGQDREYLFSRACAITYIWPVTLPACPPVSSRISCATPTERKCFVPAWASPPS